MPQTQESTAVDTATPPSPSNLAPDTGVPLNRSTLIRFGVGFFGISLLWAIGLNTVASVLLPQRLKDIGVDNPTALLGSISAVTALVSLVSNLVFGNLSDRTRSRFGKRSPWVVCGGVLGGLSLFAIGVLANSAVITVIYCVCMVGLNMMLAPAIAVLSDREKEILTLVGRAMNNREIAGDLFLAESTIKSHINRMLRKLSLRDRAQLIVLAYESGLVRAGEGPAPVGTDHPDRPSQ